MFNVNKRTVKALPKREAKADDSHQVGLRALTPDAMKAMLLKHVHSKDVKSKDVPPAKKPGFGGDVKVTARKAVK